MTEAIVDAANIVRDLRVLDVACGTGEPAISIAAALNGTGHVVATDISSAPLAIGEQRAQARNLGNVEFRIADVHALPFAERSFDRVTSRLGVMFFADAERAFREIHRVLADRGQATLLAWGPMDQDYFSTTIGTILKCMPSLRVPETGMAMFRFGKADALGNGLRKAGFQQVAEEHREVPWNWPGTPEDMWSYFQDVTAPFKPLFQSIPAESRTEIDEAVLRALRERYDGELVHFTAGIVIATALK